VIGDGVGRNASADEMTQRLLDEFDARRVVHTHIAESGFTGVGVGAAMVGLRPVVGMMTFNLVMLALDQIIRTGREAFLHVGRTIQRSDRDPGSRRPRAPAHCTALAVDRKVLLTTCPDSRLSAHRRRQMLRGS
jgi:hypothetical protein